MGSFVQRRLRASFSLQVGTFTTSGDDTLVLTNLRMSAVVTKAGGQTGSTLDISIYGMTFSQMNDLCTLGMRIHLQQGNSVLLEAGDVETGDLGMTTVFEGIILDASPDFSGMPEVAFHVMANSMPLLAVQLMESTSFLVPPLMLLRRLVGLSEVLIFKNFENGLGLMTIPGPGYFYGSPRDQMSDLADAAHIGWGFDNMTCTIFPYNGARPTPVIPLIGPLGLIKFPGFTPAGLVLESLFNPAIKWQGLIQIQSILLNPQNFSGSRTAEDVGHFFPANGQWIVTALDHHLDALVVGGQWKSILTCVNPKYPNLFVNPEILQSP